MSSENVTPDCRCAVRGIPIHGEWSTGTLKRILMTGTGGFLGSKIRRYAQIDNIASVFAVSDSVNRQNDMYAQVTSLDLRNLGPFQDDVLVLCGADYYKGNDPKQIRLMRAYNCDYTRFVIDQFLDGRGRKIVFFSSYMQLYATAAEPYAEQYLETKREMLDYISADARARVLNLYIYDNWAVDDVRSKFVPLLIQTLSNGLEFNIPSPDTLIDLCDAEALAKTIAGRCITFEEGVLSLGTGTPLSLRECAELFIRGLGLKDRVNFGVNAPHHHFIPYSDLTLGVTLRVNLE